MKAPRPFPRVVGLTLVIGLVVGVSGPVRAASPGYQPKPDDASFVKFNPRRAPEPGPLLLQKGDRLAIIGDSITEQRRYSRMMETYLTACVPQLEVTVRQYGWSGETAEGFRRRMTNDCLRFNPTVATLAYGMNDHRYRPFDVVNGNWYRSNYTAVVRGLTGAGARVVLGSPGCVSKVPHWTGSQAYTLDELNINLCALRDIGIGIAAQEGVRFADVFWPMLTAGHAGQQRFGSDEDPYMIAGKDGVHPGWAGHLVMAHAFLSGLGLDGNIATFTIDLGGGTAEASDGHRVTGFQDGTLSVTSTRYPFCASDDLDSDDSIRSGMALVPFNRQLNRFVLVVTGAAEGDYAVRWGAETRTYTAGALAEGVNLAADFVVNPFTDAFRRVDEAVKVKQAYETTQIKKIFHGEEGKRDMEAAVARTEAERAPLAEAVAAAVVPVVHTIQVTALK